MARALITTVSGTGTEIAENSRGEIEVQIFTARGGCVRFYLEGPHDLLMVRKTFNAACDALHTVNVE